MIDRRFPRSYHDGAERPRGAPEQAKAELVELRAKVASQANQLSGVSAPLSAALCMVSEVRTHTGEVKGAADGFVQFAHDVLSRTQQTQQATDELRQGARQTQEWIGRLSDDSSAIGETTAAITRIASQTNLLALNAMIEASRAGDAGAGFAVVASEVKELAREVKRAAEEVSERVAAVQAQVSACAQQTDLLFGLFGVVDESVSGIVQQVERQTEDLRRIAETADRANECVDGVAEQIEAAAELVL